MDMPSFEDMVEALQNPVITAEAAEETEEEKSEDMEMHGLILLDILKTVTRIEEAVKKPVAAVQDMPQGVGMPSGQLEIGF
jgi:hypothetical protein